MNILEDPQENGAKVTLGKCSSESHPFIVVFPELPDSDDDEDVSSDNQDRGQGDDSDY